MIKDTFRQRKKHEVMQDTWGHLYPKPGSKVPCKILVMHHDNQTIVLDWAAAVNGSPQQFDVVSSVLDMFDWVNGLHEVSCLMWFFKGCHDIYLGNPPEKLIKLSVKTLYSSEAWGV